MATALDLLYIHSLKRANQGYSGNMTLEQLLKSRNLSFEIAFQ